MGTSISLPSYDRLKNYGIYHFNEESNVDIFHYEWTFNFRRSVDCNEISLSPVFSINKQKLQLILYPCGDCEKNQNYVSLYVRNIEISESESLSRKLYCLSIINANNVVVNTTMSTEKYRTDDGEVLYGCRKFVLRDRLFKAENKLLRSNNDDLTIICKQCDQDFQLITAVRRLNQNQTNMQNIKVKNDLAKLRKNQNLTDVTLLSSDGRELEAHKAILAARSIYFAKLFEDVQSNERTFHENFRQEVLEIVLQYIYVCKLVNIEPVVQELLVAADKYDLEELKRQCEQIIGADINLNNVIELLVFADMYDAEILRLSAVNFFIENAVILNDREDFKELKKTHPHLISELLKEAILKF